MILILLKLSFKTLIFVLEFLDHHTLSIDIPITNSFDPMFSARGNHKKAADWLLLI